MARELGMTKKEMLSIFDGACSGKADGAIDGCELGRAVRAPGPAEAMF